VVILYLLEEIFWFLCSVSVIFAQLPFTTQKLLLCAYSRSHNAFIILRFVFSVLFCSCGWIADTVCNDLLERGMHTELLDDLLGCLLCRVHLLVLHALLEHLEVLLGLVVVCHHQRIDARMARCPDVAQVLRSERDPTNSDQSH
jgi:hypothetical protein